MDREALIRNVVDMHRALDYLATRADIDSRKIAFVNASPGALCFANTAVNSRYAALITIGGGLHRTNQGDPQLSIFRFAPFVRVPKLMINGKYGQLSPEAVSVAPLFRLLSEPKRGCSSRAVTGRRSRSVCRSSTGFWMR
ncbi:MAG: hypothetical protein U0Q16_33790 [Bryobacteraceae bacterium]